MQPLASPVVAALAAQAQLPLPRAAVSLVFYAAYLTRCWACGAAAATGIAMATREAVRQLLAVVAPALAVVVAVLSPALPPRRVASRAVGEAAQVPARRCAVDLVCLTRTREHPLASIAATAAEAEARVEAAAAAVARVFAQLHRQQQPLQQARCQPAVESATATVTVMVTLVHLLLPAMHSIRRLKRRLLSQLRQRGVRLRQLHRLWAPPVRLAKLRRPKPARQPQPAQLHKHDRRRRRRRHNSCGDLSCRLLLESQLDRLRLQLNQSLLWQQQPLRRCQRVLAH